MANSEEIDVSFFAETIIHDLREVLLRLSQNERHSIVLFFQEHILTGLQSMVDLESLFGSCFFIKGYDILTEKTPTVRGDRAVYILNSYGDYAEEVVRHFCVYHEIFGSSIPIFLCIPESTILFEQIVEQDYGFKEKFPQMLIESLDIDLGFIDSSFFSMNLPDSFRRIFCDGELSSLRWISRFLCKAQVTWLGPFLEIVCVGSKAKRVGDALDNMNTRGSDSATSLIQPAYKLLIIDRNVDLITPLLTQLTYEGLLDELYGFNCCQAKLPFSFEDPSEGETNYLCGINDKLFKKMRDKPFSCIGSFLYEESLTVKQKYDKRKELTQIREIREFVENLSELQETHGLIGIHTAVAKNVGKLSQNPMFRKRTVIEQYILQQTNERYVVEYIQDLINQKSDFILVLRLLCLYSTTNGGIKSREYDSFKERMMLSFGVCETVAAFLSLSKCGLLSKWKGKPKELLPLWQKYELGYRGPESNHKKDADPISQLYDGYIPPIVRLVEMFFTAGNGMANSFFFSVLQDFSSVVYHKTSVVGGIAHENGNPGRTAIFVIGGLTTAEIAGIRLLHKKYPNLPLLVFSTELLSGGRIMNSLGFGER